MRPNHNSILFDFDSLIDRKIGIVRYVANNLETLFNPKKFDTGFLRNDSGFFQSIRITQNEPILRMMFRNKKYYDENKATIYSDFISEAEEEISRLSPVTAMINLIAAYRNVGSDSIRTTILCKSEYEQSVCKKLFQNTPVIMHPDRKNVDLGPYGRITVSDITDIEYFTKPKAKHIMVLNYLDNYVYNEATLSYLLNPGIIIKYGDINEFEVADPYLNPQIPEG